MVEQKTELMRKLGKKELTLQLQEPLAYLPEALSNYPIELKKEGLELVYTFDSKEEQGAVAGLLRRLVADGIEFKDLQTKQSSLEDIFVELVREQA